MENLQVIEVKGQRVLTTKQIAKLYGAEEEKIRWNYKYNKEKYTEGKHYILIQGEELRELKRECEFHTLLKQAKSVCFWTEKGALLHAKSLNTDKAWEVYDYLVDFYFCAQDEKKVEAKGEIQDEPRQQATEKNAVIPVKTGVEKVPEAIEEKKRTIPVYSMEQFGIAKRMLVDIPENAEAQKLIGDMRKYLTGMDALLDTYNMYHTEEEFKEVSHTVNALAGRILWVAHHLSYFKPKLVEKWNM